MKLLLRILKMNPYAEFEQYLNDGRSNEVIINPVTVMFSLFSILKKMNDENEIEHPFVNFLYEKYNYLNKNVKYKDVCTYVIHNLETGYFYIGSGSEYARRYAH